MGVYTQSVKIPIDKTNCNFKLVEVPEVPIVEDGDLLQAVPKFLKDVLFLSSEEEQIAILEEYLRSLKGFLRSLYALENTVFAPALNGEGLPATLEDEAKLDRGYKRVPIYRVFQNELNRINKENEQNENQGGLSE